MPQKTRRFAAAALLATAFVSVSHAQTTSSWVLPVSGNWTDPTKWSTDPFYPNNGTPVASSYIANLAAVGANYTVSLNAGEQVAVSTLNISSANATLAMTGGTLSTVSRFTAGGNVSHTAGQININSSLLFVGDLHGNSTYNHSGGTLSFGQYFEVGVLLNDTAHYNVSGSAFVSGGTLLVGANFSSGTMTQTGGTVQLSTMLDMADGVETSRATYQLDGGTFNVIAAPGANANMFIGSEGSGTFNQTGGSVVIQGAAQSSMVLGDAVTTTIPGLGTYNMSGGTIQSPALVAGHFGNGTFIQSGGTHSISGVIRLGRDVGSNGYYQLSGTGVLNANGQVNVGSAGFGTFVQSGGTTTINGPLVIATGGLSQGRYTMSGGVANVAGVTGTGTLEPSGSARMTADFVRTGTFTIDSGSQVTIRPSGAAANVSSPGFFSISGGATPTGTLDLSNNDLRLASGNAATTRAQIAFARHAAAWDRAGITSSSARDAAIKNTGLGLLTGIEYLAVNAPLFDGQVVLPTDVLVKYTWNGDTDFNGVVNFDDYSRTDIGFSTNRTGWLNGDFDYSGAVNFDDYALIDLSFNTQSGSLRRAMSYLDGGDRSTNGMDAPSLLIVMQHFEQFGNSYSTSFLNAVPEPTSALALAGVQALACMTMRRQRKPSRN